MKKRNGIEKLRMAFAIVVFMLVLVPSVHAEVINCNNCSDCSAKIQSASAGDVVKLTEDITNHYGNCIEFNDKDGITFDGDNYMIYGDNDFEGYGIYLSYQSNNNIIKNCKINDFRYGIYLSNSDNNNLTNNTANDNNRYGINMPGSDNNTVENNTLNSNTNGGIYLSNSDYNTIEGNTLSQNVQHGIYTRDSGNNSIYNNYFNNTDNVNFMGTLYSNKWNTTKIAGTNIINGAYIGGNYWAYLDGTGFSETGTDTDEDGICDNYYTLATNNIDYLPLTEPPVPQVIIYVNETGWWIEPDQFNPSSTPIQSAIDHATAGNTIIVKNGAYTENVDVDKCLTIRSENGPENCTVNAAIHGDSVFELIWSADNTNLSGFTVSGATGTDSAGISLVGVSHCNISGNIVSGNNEGILVFDEANNNKIINNTITSNSGDGIYLFWAVQNTIENNNVSLNSNQGIFINFSGSNTIANNTMAGNTYNFGVSGNYLADYTQDIDTSNLIEGKPVYYWIGESDRQVPSDAGFVGIVNSSKIIVKDLTMTENLYGVMFAFTYDSTIENVTASANMYGIYMTDSSENNLTGNIISDNNGKGIHIQSSGMNLIYNNLFNNTNNFGIEGTIAKNDWNTTKTSGKNIINGSYLGGNYWAMPSGTGFSETCTDTEGDGICDNYYNLTTNNVDYLPLVRVRGDLEITDVWVNWPDNCTICYNVTNIGTGTASEGHNTSLYVDSVEKAYDFVAEPLMPNESYTGCFNYTWEYKPPEDNITVCVDFNDTVTESNETNNCLSETWMCGDVNMDGTVTPADSGKVFNHYLDSNYPLGLSWAADVNGDGTITPADSGKIFNRYLDSSYDMDCCCARKDRM
ncbi:CASH domain-dontaining protein [Candidatus Methanophagaceae archaeon]|nr:CASH domain-dontaining protein [Methanophagales archaeon]